RHDGLISGSIGNRGSSLVGGNCRATEDLSRRSSYLRLSKVEAGIVRIGTVIHRVATLEGSSRGRAVTEESLEVRLGSDKFVLVGDVDPTLNIGREAGRLWS